MAETSGPGTHSQEGEGAQIFPFNNESDRRRPEQTLEMALAVWRHPTTSIDDVTERVAGLTIDDSDEERNKRLRKFVGDINVSDALYDKLLDESPTFNAMIELAKKLRAHPEDAGQTLIRLATLKLMDMLAYSYEHPEGAVGAEDIAEVFGKIYYAMEHPGRQ